MGKKIEGNEGPTLGIQTSSEMFEKLKFESARLQKSWHPYDSFNFIVTAWHLFQDWPKSGDSSYLSKSKRQKTHLPPDMIRVLDTIKDLCNGSKHLILDPKATIKRRVEEVHSGEVTSWSDYFFQERILGVTVDVNWYFSIRVLHNIIMYYFDWVFDESEPLCDFPPELSEAISYCKIKNRAGEILSPAAVQIIGQIVL